MSETHKHFSDIIHGFVGVPREVLLPLVLTPDVQRLRRIRQLGVGYLVFPCAEHSRFTHALGTLALMQDVLQSFRSHGTPISDREYKAALAAALLHDIGHGPFSHTLEFRFIPGVSHESIGLALVRQLRDRVGEPLDLTIRMMQGTYERTFFHDLIDGQLDLDRLDYLRRDSHFTGVVEGRIGTDRIVKTMRVHPPQGGPDSRVVVMAKGVYAVENVLLARRLMYWQVYLHKTVVAGDRVLLAAMQRARAQLTAGNARATEGVSPALRYFLETPPDPKGWNQPEVLDAFIRMDDDDVLFSLKRWMHSPDAILADLSRRFIERDLFRCVYLEKTPSLSRRKLWQEQVAESLVRQGLSDPSRAEADAAYYFSVGNANHAAYERRGNRIHILHADGNLHELSASADTRAMQALTRFARKPYVCLPKEAGIARPEQG